MVTLLVIEIGMDDMRIDWDLVTYADVVVPEPWQSGFGSRGEGWAADIPLERRIGESGFRTRQRTFHGGIQTW